MLRRRLAKVMIVHARSGSRVLPAVLMIWRSWFSRYQSRRANAIRFNPYRLHRLSAGACIEFLELLDTGVEESSV